MRAPILLSVSMGYGEAPSGQSCWSGVDAPRWTSVGTKKRSKLSSLNVCHLNLCLPETSDVKWQNGVSETHPLLNTNASEFDER